MARDERGMSRPSLSKKSVGGKASGDVPGQRKVTKPLGEKSNRSAAHYADAVSLGSHSNGGQHKYDNK